MRSPRFKNPSKVPPGGIQFTQMEIGWKAPYPLSENVQVLAKRVQQLRQNNPVLVRLQLPTDLRMIIDEIIIFNCVRNPAICIDPKAEEMSKEPIIPQKKPVACCGGAA